MFVLMLLEAGRSTLIIQYRKGLISRASSESLSLKESVNKASKRGKGHTDSFHHRWVLLHEK